VSAQGGGSCVSAAHLSASVYNRPVTDMYFNQHRHSLSLSLFARAWMDPHLVP